MPDPTNLKLIIQPPPVLRATVTPPAEFKTTLQVGQGPAGRDGRDGTGGDSHYPHNQAVPDTVWVIDHNLGKYPSVICFDSANDEIEGMISYPTLNRVTVTFSAATGGYAYLN